MTVPAHKQTPTLNDVLPAPHYREIYSILVDASREEAMAVTRKVSAREVRLLRPFFAIRSMPQRLGRRSAVRFDPDAPLWPQLTGVLGFKLFYDEDRAEAFGEIGQPHKLRGGEEVGFVDAEAFGSFVVPGYCKVAADFRADRDGAKARLSTETRVACTDERTHRAFRRYWFVIRLASGAIRKSWLRAVKRRLAAGAEPL